MANDNLQGGCALANELGRQPDETSQQHADRLLDAKRRGVSMVPAPASTDLAAQLQAFRINGAAELHDCPGDQVHRALRGIHAIACVLSGPRPEQRRHKRG